LFVGQNKEAEKLAQEKLMGVRKTGSPYQTLGGLFLNFEHPKETSSITIANSTLTAPSQGFVTG
jgi:hypothetical protein